MTIPMQSIAYTAGAGDSLTLQIAAYSTLYSNSSIGLINISDIQLDLPVQDHRLTGESGRACHGPHVGRRPGEPTGVAANGSAAQPMPFLAYGSRVLRRTAGR